MYCEFMGWDGICGYLCLWGQRVSRLINNNMMQYKVGDIVFAKCQNYPFWPGKVILVYPITVSYKILIYGEKSEATIE